MGNFRQMPPLFSFLICSHPWSNLPEPVFATFTWECALISKLLYVFRSYKAHANNFLPLCECVCFTLCLCIIFYIFLALFIGDLYPPEEVGTDSCETCWGNTAILETDIIYDGSSYCSSNLLHCYFVYLLMGCCFLPLKEIDCMCFFLL